MIRVFTNLTLPAQYAAFETSFFGFVAKCLAKLFKEFDKLIFFNILNNFACKQILSACMRSYVYFKFYLDVTKILKQKI